MEKTVSIIIPTYNRRHLIGTTIDNILRQTLPVHEIIVVDDHSTDETLEWLKETYGDKLILLTNDGKGPGAARNTGLKIATGSYIKFFDSDDLMTSNTLEVQVETLEKSDKGYITGPYFYASEENEQWIPKDNVILNYHNFPQNKPLWHWMIWGLFITIPGMLFRRDFLDSVGPWPEDIITSEDWLYLWRIAQKEPYPAHDSRCAFIYRLHGEQSVGNNFDNLKRDKEKFKILKNIFESDIKPSDKYTWWQKQIFINKFYQTARVCIDPCFKQELLSISGNFSKIIWQLYRLKMKWGRIKTKTDWQPFHGVNLDKVMVSNYTNFINCE
ncbi:glycosyltransferase family 2 protein [Labilibacter marinus]|uniref:glycosyltransferase family 2 protein n=1 Tax=Labilibacter marinus TaxID=1477105 RepID=UPI00094F7AE9|nr:glycosyltransferase family 2 protein [Labilibacter marinus]